MKYRRRNGKVYYIRKSFMPSRQPSRHLTSPEMIGQMIGQTIGLLIALVFMLIIIWLPLFLFSKILFISCNKSDIVESDYQCFAGTQFELTIKIYISFFRRILFWFRVTPLICSNGNEIWQHI
jgi:hypothetical protein